MPLFIVVNDTDGTFRVHRKGCGDIKRRRMANAQWEREASDADEVVRLERQGLRESGFGDDADDFQFVVLPCAREAQ